MFMMLTINDNDEISFVTKQNTLEKTREHGIELLETNENFMIVPVVESGSYEDLINNIEKGNYNTDPA